MGIKNFNVVFNIYHTPQLKKSAVVHEYLLQGNSMVNIAKRTTRNEMSQYFEKSPKITVEKGDVLPGEGTVYFVYANDIPVGDMTILEISYEEYIVQRQAALAQLEAHRPVELHGELLIAAWPAPDYSSIHEDVQYWKW